MTTGTLNNISGGVTMCEPNCVESGRMVEAPVGRVLCRPGWIKAVRSGTVEGLHASEHPTNKKLYILTCQFLSLSVERPACSLDFEGTLGENIGMVIHGRVHNGVVVLEGGLKLPEGMQVTISCLSGQVANRLGRSVGSICRSCRPIVHVTTDSRTGRGASGPRRCFCLTSIFGWRWDLADTSIIWLPRTGLKPYQTSSVASVD